MIDSGIYTVGRVVVYQIMQVYAIKMAGVLAAHLPLSTGHLAWAPLAFPLWVLLISGHILLTDLRSEPRL